MQQPNKLTKKEKAILQAEQQKSKGTSTQKINDDSSLNFKLGLIVALLGLGLYLNTLSNGFVYDDVDVITRNHLVKEGMHSIPVLLTTSYRKGVFEGDDELYRPLPMIVFATVWQFFPNNPFPGHFLNIILYALTGFFLFKLLRKLLSTYNVIVPFVASVIFIAHPIHTEVVANIKSLDEIMAFLFIIFSFLFLLRYFEKGVKKDLIFSSICFFTAILSKESAVMMIVIIPLTIYFFREVRLNYLLKVISILCVPLVVYLFMRISALGAAFGTKHFAFIDNILVEAPDFLTRSATVFFILMQYFKLILFPHPLSGDYSYKYFELTGWGNPVAIISFLIHVGLFIYALKGIRKKNIFAWCILFYLLAIFLSSNLLIMIGTAFAERFLYVPLLGFTVAASILLLKISSLKDDGVLKLKTIDAFIKNNSKPLGIIVLLLLPMCYKTIARNDDWKSDFSLFNADVKNNSKSARTHYSHADIIVNEKVMKGEESEKISWVDSALSEYNQAIEIYPSYTEAYGQRGFAYFIKGDNANAFENYKRSIELNSVKETTYLNMGYLFSEKNEHEKALPYYNKSIELNPRSVEAWSNLGSTYYALKDFNKALTSFSTALKYAPDDANLNFYMGSTYLALGDSVTAQQFIDKANLLKK